jgi:hypothetical protein
VSSSMAQRGLLAKPAVQIKTREHPALQTSPQAHMI